MSVITMKYGGVAISPVPLITLDKNILKTGDGITRGTTFQITLSGTLVNKDDQGGLKNITDKIRDLREIFDVDGKHFIITCDGTTLLEAYPRIVNEIRFNQSNDNWIFSCPYTITLEFDHEPANEDIIGSGENFPSLHPPFISDFSESWTIEPTPDQSNHFHIGNESNPYVFRFTHNISAVGKSHYSGPGNTGTLDKPAWQQARDYIDGHLGYDEAIFLSQGILNLATGVNKWTPYDHYVTNNIDEANGSISVQESWLVLGGTGTLDRNAIEDFVITHQDGINQASPIVSIQGTVRGLGTHSYSDPFTVTSTKYNAAKSYWSMVKPELKNRCQVVLSNLANTPTQYSIAHSPNQGLISYNYSYEQCNNSYSIPGARYVDLSTSESGPRDVFAVLPILGRQNGPIIQKMNTFTESSFTVTLEAVMDCTGSRPSLAVSNAAIASATGAWAATYDTIVLSSDVENWAPRTGRYTRSVTYLGTNCS